MRYDLGTIPGANRPSDIMNANRSYGWGLFSIFMLAANLSLIIFAVWGWR